MEIECDGCDGTCPQCKDLPPPTPEEIAEIRQRMKDAPYYDLDSSLDGAFREVSKNFKSELRSIINRCSMENGSNTPDFILATYLVKCLENFDMAVCMRDSWYGVNLQPGCSATNNAPKAGDPVGELEELLDRRY
jgi:hypothetical protein